MAGALVIAFSAMLVRLTDVVLATVGPPAVRRDEPFLDAAPGG